MFQSLWWIGGKGWGENGHSPLVRYWSGVCQSPRTRPWSSSWSGWAGRRGSACHSQRGQTEPGLAIEFEQAVGNKNVFYQFVLPLDLLQFHQIHREFVPGRKAPSPRATIFFFQTNIFYRMTRRPSILLQLPRESADNKVTPADAGKQKGN